MPKIVDSEERRAALAEALWRVLAREGIEGATVRAVAAEAGWSRGIIEHYFAGKQEMLLYACRLASERALAQVQERHRTLVGAAALRAVLLHDLALRGERREAAGAWFGCSRPPPTIPPWPPSWCASTPRCAACSPRSSAR